MNNLKELTKVLMLKLNEDDSTAATILESLNSFKEAPRDLKGLFDIKHEEGGSDGDKVSCKVWQNDCEALLETAILLTECLTKLESVHQELMEEVRLLREKRRILGENEKFILAFMIHQVTV